jgi:hypothetical protein
MVISVLNRTVAGSTSCSVSDWEGGAVAQGAGTRQVGCWGRGLYRDTWGVSGDIEMVCRLGQGQEQD